MPRIQVLEKQVAELIAAGEVVERPSSVIKELVENAVDAGSTVVTVEIRRGGAPYMRVTDNGCGIDPQEVPTAFLRHATSKIVTQGDLDAIGTLGFRGEALAAISAVGRVEMLTKTAGQETGLRYTCAGDEPPAQEEAGCPQGTTIVVRDLFFNTPARMKFLKKDVTEGNAVAGILDKIALSHPEVSLRLVRDGKEVLHTPGDGQLASALYAVYGREFFQTLLPVDYTLGGIRVEGFVSKPSGSRANRSMQNFFLNGRTVRSRTACAALEEACKGAVMAGKFPACALHLHLPPEAVDVNVHPSKMEVRFVNERPVFDAVYHGVKSALQRGDSPKTMGLIGHKPILPTAPPPEKAPQLTMASPPPEEAEPEISIPRLSLRDSGAPALHPQPFDRDMLHLLDDAMENRPQPQPTPLKQRPSLHVVEAPPNQPPPPHKAEAAPQPPQGQPAGPPSAPAPQPEIPPFLSLSGKGDGFHGKIIGEAFGTYILVEYSPRELMLIDKHAAHERLLYEKLKAQELGGAAQALLAPVPVQLEQEEYSAVLAHLGELEKAGFVVEDFGPGTVLVRAAPLLLDGADAAQAIMETAGHLCAHKTDLTTAHLDWVYHNVACRAAMKAGDTTHPEELIALCRQLEENPQVRYCPHGRPVYILLPRREIEKQFGRA